MSMVSFDTQKLHGLQGKEKKTGKQNVLTDPLTGLHNRSYLRKSIPADIALAKKDYRYWSEDYTRPMPSRSDIVFLMVGIDNPDSIDELYGDKAIDSVFMQVADLLRNMCGESDLAIRWQDNKLLIVNRFVSLEQAKALAERLSREIKDHIFDLGKIQTKRITCSIGLAAYPFRHTDIDKLDWEQVVDIADKALDAAKTLGPNTWVGILSTEKTDIESIYNEISPDGEDLLAKLKELENNAELKILTSHQNGLEIKKREDFAESSRLPEGFYKPIKVEKYLEFNREELYRDF